MTHLDKRRLERAWDSDAPQFSTRAVAAAREAVMKPPEDVIDVRKAVLASVPGCRADGHKTLPAETVAWVRRICVAREHVRNIALLIGENGEGVLQIASFEASKLI